LMTCTTETVSKEKKWLCGYTCTIWTRVWLLTAPFVGSTSIFGQLGSYFVDCSLICSYETIILSFLSSTNGFIATQYCWIIDNIGNRHASNTRETQGST
jgi:hypothetical protein